MPNVGIGTTPSDLLHLSSAATGGTAIRLQNSDTGGKTYSLISSGSSSTGGAGNFVVYDVNSLAIRMMISSAGNVGIALGSGTPSYTLDVTGTIRATNLILTSDRRAKKNINSLDEAESLDKLSRLNPVSFEWKNSGEADLGIIAQELAEVYPELVLKDANGALSIRSTSLIAPIIASVKKLKSDNDQLRAENEKQKSRLDELEKKMSALTAKLEK